MKIQDILQQKPTLTVYKASAGSGKTFKLSTAYMRLLILNPQSLQGILAVTFTNKATAEMKQRILSQLYGVWKQLPGSESYLNELIKTTGMGRQMVSERAGLAINYLMRHYSYFQVQTIDSFFQRVLRNIGRELGLNADLTLGLNDKLVESEAVDQMITQLADGSKVMDWIMDFVEDKMQNDENWNVTGLIKGFGLNIFKSFYKQNSKAIMNVLQDPEKFKQYNKVLKQIETDADNQLQQAATRFFDILEKNGLEVADLSYKSNGPASYFIKLQGHEYHTEKLLTKRVTDALDDDSMWLPKNQRQGTAMQVVTNYISPLLHHTEDQRQVLAQQYYSAIITRKHLYQLRLLGAIESKVRQLNAQSSQFLLSDTQFLLKNLIADSDSPFIYERIGTRLNNIMIDEFQDTSTEEWQNFKVLLADCMSRGDSWNLIVGDVKQSIYRWRQGDWKLLNNIDKQFGPDKSNIGIEYLDHNYRSTYRVVTFNNAFFKLAAQAEFESMRQQVGDSAAVITQAYADVEQKLPHGKPQTGYVSVSLINNSKPEYEMQLLLDTIKQLLKQGIVPDDIAILARTNTIIQQIAQALGDTMPGVPVVSSEAYRMDGSPAVNIIINAMRWLVHPDDKILTATLVKTWLVDISQQQQPLSDILGTDPEQLIKRLPEKFVARREELMAMPLADLAEAIFQLFNVGSLSGQDAYMCAFNDAMQHYQTNHPGSLQEFLKQWQQELAQKTIQADDVQGIHLYTIHKSKGLEFKTVIVPFCDWQMEKANYTLWCATNVKPYNQIPIVPVDYAATKLKGTIYEASYNEEHLDNCIDNLNLLYVALTRARNNLLVIAHKGSASQRSFIFNDIMPELKDQLPDCTMESHELDEDVKVETLHYGSLIPSEAKHDENDGNVFTVPARNFDLKIQSFPLAAHFVQSNQSLEFTGNDEEQERTKYITVGNVMHSILSGIHTINDLPQALATLQSSGVLPLQGVDPLKMARLLEQRLTTSEAKEWFSPKWQMFNECSILWVDPDTLETRRLRPDRVITNGDEYIVIDFKFGSHKDDYIKQVRRYMVLISQMENKPVKGFLWYVYTDKIVPVTFNS